MGIFSRIGNNELVSHLKDENGRLRERVATLETNLKEERERSDSCLKEARKDFDDRLKGYEDRILLLMGVNAVNQPLREDAAPRDDKEPVRQSPNQRLIEKDMADEAAEMAAYEAEVFERTMEELRRKREAKEAGEGLEYDTSN